MDLTDAELALWDPWTPAELAERLAGVPARWYVLAGWALDLFLARQTREHEDIEIGVPSVDFPAIRDALGEYELLVVGGGKALPVTPSTLAAHRQTWVREPATGTWRLDVIRERWEDGTWIYDRDPRIRRSGIEAIAHTPSGIPYLQPDIVLLFKASGTRPKDEDDFATVLPALGPSRRAWLADALELTRPGHHWLAALRAET